VPGATHLAASTPLYILSRVLSLICCGIGFFSEVVSYLVLLLTGLMGNLGDFVFNAVNLFFDPLSGIVGGIGHSLTGSVHQIRLFIGVCPIWIV
jgi:hypothetical protein